MWKRQMYIWQKLLFRFPILWSYSSHTGHTPFRRYLGYPCTSCNMQLRITCCQTSLVDLSKPLIFKRITAWVWKMTIHEKDLLPSCPQKSLLALPRSSGWARTATRGAETLKRPAVPMGKGRQDSADFNSWRWVGLRRLWRWRWLQELGGSSHMSDPSGKKTWESLEIWWNLDGLELQKERKPPKDCR